MSLSLGMLYLQFWLYKKFAYAKKSEKRNRQNLKDFPNHRKSEIDF